MLKEYRGLGFGALLVEQMMTEILPTKTKIYLHAQSHLESFYEKFGFKRVGEKFTEAGIEHYKMEYISAENQKRYF